MTDPVQRARDVLEGGGMLLSQPTPAGPITPYKRALREAHEALAALAALPVIRTCGDCGWCKYPGGERDLRPMCFEPLEPRDVDADGPPPAWCPLREVKP